MIRINVLNNTSDRNRLEVISHVNTIETANRVVNDILVLMPNTHIMVYECDDEYSPSKVLIEEINGRRIKKLIAGTYTYKIGFSKRF